MRKSIAAILLASTLAVSFAPAHSQGSDQAEEDEQKTLGQVTVEGKAYDDLPPLPTGQIQISPELIARVNGEGGRAALHNYYELVFDPVLINSDGSVVPDPDPRRSREVLRPRLKEARPRTGSHIKRIPPSFYRLTLEEGFYALTQINYRIQTRIPIILDPEEPGSVIDAELERSLDIFQFCLAKGTLLFDVTEDSVATFGKIMIRGLDRRDETYPEHFPIVATDDPTTRPANGYIFAKDPDPVAWGVGFFYPETGLCHSSNHFVTSGWPIAENWQW